MRLHRHARLCVCLQMCIYFPNKKKSAYNVNNNKLTIIALSAFTVSGPGSLLSTLLDVTQVFLTSAL